MFTTALVGQPNVGKSSLFTRLTGVGVISSNYPGTTVAFEEAVIMRKGNKVRVYDLPGTYGMSGNSEDENVVLEMVKNPEIDSVIVIADAANLQSSLVLCFEVIELGIPMILAINKIDEAKKKFDTDFDALEKLLDVPVIPVSAKTSDGVDALADAVCEGRARVSSFKVKYDGRLEPMILSLSERTDSARFGNFGTAVKLMEDAETFIDDVDDDVAATAEKYRNEFETAYDESAGIQIARDRYSISDAMVRKIQFRTQNKMSRKDRLSEIMITPSTGIPILVGVMMSVFLAIIFIGNFLDELIEDLYVSLVGDTLANFGHSIGGDFGYAVMQGVDQSILAVLTLIIPYILVFYIILGILEDSGYLPRAVVLLDRIMHRFGLHGGAFIPMIVGLGCNVPAIMATRTIHSRREKIIVTTLIAICVPCSAQLAIIFGIVGNFSGIFYAFLILLIVLALMVVLGVALNHFLKMEPSNLAMEIPDLTVPTVKNVLFKTWDRIKEFFYIAFPLLVVGSVLVQIALNYDLLDFIVEPMSFITVTMLGLPAVVIIAFLAGILRKEMAVVILAAVLSVSESGLVDMMSPEQFFVFGLIMAIYMPCLATMAVIWQELGWKETVLIAVFSIGIAIAIGSIAHLMFTIF
ncbi:MAG: ferrous iron transport protein B [Candidatus Methanomethylophilaceae archaeon]